MTAKNSGAGTNRRVAVFANAAAGRDRAALNAALERFNALEVDYECHWPTDIDELQAQLRTARRTMDVVVLAGGDGTINAALPAVTGEGAALGLLPLGTANDLARSLGLPFEPAAAAEAIVTGHRCCVDVACVNGRYFVNVAHIGLGVRARDEGLSDSAKRRWRALSYPLSLLRMVRRLRAFRVEVSVDGEFRRLRALHLAVGNGRFYGGGIPIQADADIADALLDVYCVPPQGFIGLLRAAWDVWRGGTPGSPVWRATGRLVEVHTRRHRRIMGDGERLARTPARFEVLPGILPVIMPRGGDTPEDDT